MKKRLIALISTHGKTPKEVFLTIQKAMRQFETTKHLHPLTAEGIASNITSHHQKLSVVGATFLTITQQVSLPGALYASKMPGSKYLIQEALAYLLEEAVREENSNEIKRIYFAYQNTARILPDTDAEIVINYAISSKKLHESYSLEGFQRVGVEEYFKFKPIERGIIKEISRLNQEVSDMLNKLKI